MPWGAPPPCPPHPRPVADPGFGLAVGTLVTALLTVPLGGPLMMLPHALGYELLGIHPAFDIAGRTAWLPFVASVATVLSAVLRMARLRGAATAAVVGSALVCVCVSAPCLVAATQLLLASAPDVNRFGILAVFGALLVAALLAMALLPMVLLGLAIGTRRRSGHLTGR